MAKPVSTLKVSEQQKRELRRLIQAPTSAQRMVPRARVVLLRSSGVSQELTAEPLGINRPRRTHLEWLAFLRHVVPL